VTGSILSAAQAYNQLHGISGLLCQGQGLYLQVLEGERSAVNQPYAPIIHEPRHKDVQLLQLEEISERRYAQ
jgi:Sensors of blue-light using FAD